MMRIGTDIIEIARVEKNLVNEKFLQRVYSAKELAFYPEHWRGENMAARFCAKEALIKVFGRGIPLYEISILNDEYGRPYYELEGSAEVLRRELNIDQIDLSLSHCREYAVAFAIGRCSDERKV